MATISSRIKLKRWNGSGHTDDKLLAGAPLFNTTTKELLIGNKADGDGSQVDNSGILVDKSKTTDMLKDSRYLITSDNSLVKLKFGIDPTGAVITGTDGGYGEFSFQGTEKTGNNFTTKEIIKANLTDTEFYGDNTPTVIAPNGNVLVGNNLTAPGTITAEGGFIGNASSATTAGSANRAVSAQVAHTTLYTTEAPTSAPPENTLAIYYGTTVPATRYERVLYLISY